MKLYVDDIRNAPDESWTVARTVGAAIKAIAMFGNSITDISLDHDISHQVTIGDLSRPYPCDETFMPVADYIALKWNMETHPGSPIVPLVTLHTSNPVGAEMMKSVLEPHVNVVVKPTHLANRLEMEV